MNCIQIIVPVVYVILQLKTISLAAKCHDKACQNLKDGTTDYGREVFNHPERFTVKGLRLRNPSFHYFKLSLIVFVIGAITLGLMFGNY